jgi:hypothetical protein
MVVKKLTSGSIVYAMKVTDKKSWKSTMLIAGST